MQDIGFKKKKKSTKVDFRHSLQILEHFAVSHY